MNVVAYISSSLASSGESCSGCGPDGLRVEKAFAARDVHLVDFPIGSGWWRLFRFDQTILRLDLFRAIRLSINQRRLSAVFSSTVEGIFFLMFLKKWGLFLPPIILHDIQIARNWRCKKRMDEYIIPHVDVAFGMTRWQAKLIAKMRGDEIVVVSGLTTDVNFFRRVSLRPHGGYVFSPGEDGGRDFSTLLKASQNLDVDVVIKTSRRCIESQIFGNNRIRIIEKYLRFEEFRKLYEDAAVVVVPAVERLNACGITVCAEALCMETPLVMTRTSVLGDEWPDDICLKVPVADAVALERAIRWVLDNPTEADHMARRGRKFAEKFFCAERVVGNIMEVIEGRLKS